MALPVTIPNTFANATASIPLSQLDTNFNTLANAVNGISDGSETLANASVTVLTAGTVDINGGAIDGTTVGTSNAAAGSFTTLNTSGAVVFNDAGADVDFRVEGDTDANLFFVDASANAVGVGTNAPKVQAWRTGSTLTVQGTVAGNYEVSSSRTDADTVAVGSYQFALTTADASHKTIAVIEVETSGATAGQRGGAMRFLTKSNGTATPAERMRITSAGAVEIANGNLKFSTNGTGIDFSASAGGGASSSLLDDYEEGTWTPVLSGAGGNPSVGYLVQVGNYTKIGNVVTVWARVTINSISGGSGALFFSGLPFTGSLSNNEFAGPMEASFVNFGAGYTAANSRVLSNATDIYMNITGSNAVANTVNVSAVGSSADFVFGCTYRAA